MTIFADLNFLFVLRVFLKFFFVLAYCFFLLPSLGFEIRLLLNADLRYQLNAISGFEICFQET